MKALATSQDASARRAHIAPINLVKLTTNDAAQTWYLSDRAVKYDFDGAGVEEFWPWVLSFGALSRGISHLPDPSGANLTGGLAPNEGRLSWRVVLSNQEWEGERIAETLDAYTLEGASIEWAQILYDANLESFPVDLSALSSTDKTVFFRGRVRQVGPITDERIELAASIELPEIDWSYNTEASAAREDVGARVPLVYGAAQHIPCVSWDAGAVAALELEATDTATSLALYDSSAFPSSGSVRVGAEQVSYTGNSTNTLTGCTRGTALTEAVTHRRGERVVEVKTETYIVSENTPSAVGAIYVAHPLRGGELVPLTAGSHYSLTLDDTTTIPGKTIAALTVNASQYLAIISELAVGDVVNQPEGEGGTPTDVDDEAATGYTNYGVNGPDNVIDNAPGTQGFLASDDAIRVEFDAPAGPITGGLTAEVLIGASGIHPANTVYVGSENGLADIATLTDALTPGTWYSFAQTAGLNNGYFWLWSDGLSVASGISGVRRDYTYNASGYEPTVFVKSDTFPLAFYADVDGPVVQEEINHEETSQLDALDAIGSWAAADGTVASDTGDKNEGAASLRLTGDDFDQIGTNPTAITELESASGWTLESGQSAAVDNSFHTDGQSIKLSLTAGATWGPRKTITAIDLDGADWLRLNLATDKNSGSNYIRIRLHEVYNASYIEFYFSTWQSLVNADTWYTVLLDPANGTEQGSPDLTNLTIFQILWGTGDSSIWIDEPDVITAPAHGSAESIDVEAYENVSQRDYTPNATGYEIDAKHTAPADSSSAYWFSSAVSGTPKPANRLELQSLGGATWTGLTRTAATIGSGATLTDIRSHGLTMTHVGATSLHGVGVFAATYLHPVDATGGIVRIDDVRKYITVVDEEEWTDYKVSAGNLIEHPADVFRHLVQEIAGGTVDETSVVAAETNLGSNELAFDARALGLSFADVLGRLGFESRANIVRLEKASGSEWAMLTASSAYGFPTPDDSVAVWDRAGVALQGRDLGSELFTRFGFFYAYDAALGTSDVGFTLFLRCSPSQNDLSSKVATALITAAETAHGSREAPPLEFRAIRDPATAIDVAGYYVTETLRRPKLFLVGGAVWYDGLAYALELGDTRYLTPGWSSTPVKTRLIEITKSDREELELRVAEVA